MMRRRALALALNGQADKAKALRAWGLPLPVIEPFKCGQQIVGSMAFPLVLYIRNHIRQRFLTEGEHSVFRLPSRPLVLTFHRLVIQQMTARPLELVDDSGYGMAWRYRQCEMDMIRHHTNRVYEYAFLLRDAFQ